MHQFIYDKDKTIVETSAGKIRGYQYDGLCIFKGVPYARAQRFHAPKAMKAWDGVLDCTSFGYVCPLLQVEKPAIELCVPHRYWMMDEECQNLNIWTPGLDGKKRPVMVWLHGGGYEGGSAIEHLAYEGENMAKNGDVVVISINHRLNVIGYMDLSDFGEEYENSGNAGTADQIAALRWIRENVEKFGGDPENICLFGQSGGGGKITTLLQSPEADGLFHKGIIMSGVLDSLLPDAVGSGKEFVLAMMEELGLNSVKELEKISYHQLAEAYVKLRPVYQEKGCNIGNCPHPNKHYLGDPSIHGFRQETAHIPLLVGTVFGEFLSFNPAPMDKNILTEKEAEEYVFGEIGSQDIMDEFRKVYPRRSILDLLQLDYVFRGPTIRYVKKRSQLNSHTYSYLFEQDTALEQGRVPWHCADIPYVFHNTQMAYYTQTEGVEELEERIFRTVMAFARTGDPNNDLIPDWQANQADQEHIMFFGKEVRVGVNLDHHLIALAEQKMSSYYEKKLSGTKIQH